MDTYENSRTLVLGAFDLGITHFDLANNYGPPPGAAEENFGRILRDDLAPFRDEIIISTKAGYTMWSGPYGDWGSRKYLLSSLDQSLRRIGVGYVDIFSIRVLGAIHPDPTSGLRGIQGWIVPTGQRPLLDWSGLCCLAGFAQKSLLSVTAVALSRRSPVPYIVPLPTKLW